MQIRCPHCRSPIEDVSPDLSAELTCPTCGSAFRLVGESTVKQPRGVPRQVAHFELVEQIGMGTFGTVWRAIDRELDRIVAVKLPRKEQLEPGEAEQFLREARASAQLRHPHIVSVHEVGREGDTIYIVSDLVTGMTLADWLSGQMPTPRETAEITAHVATALEHAHQRGVIHRDLKPGNIMIDGDGAPHLMDFGLAKREAADVTVTVDGHVFGTPGYMSPEQARGEARDVDRRTDLYSLGVVLFQMLTGELPFRGTPRMLLHQVLNEEPRSPRSLNDRVPRDLETITLKAMAKEPARRYQTAAELSDDLNRWLSGEPILARPIGAIERSWRWCRRNPAVAVLAAGLLGALVCGLGGVTWQWRRAERERRLADRIQVEALERADDERQARLEAVEAKRAVESALLAEEGARKTAQLERERAAEHFQRARNAVDRYFTQISESRLLDEPGMQPLRRELLEQASQYYEQFRSDQADEPQGRAEFAAAQLRLAQIRMVMGQTDAAIDALAEALSIVDGLLKEGVDPGKFPVWFAGSFRAPRYNRRDSALPSNPFRAVGLLKKACTIWERLVAAAPQAPGFRQDLAGCYYHYGVALFVFGQKDAAVEYLQKSCQLLDNLIAEQPDVSAHRDEYALVASATGEFLELAGNAAGARRTYEQALLVAPRSPPLHNCLARLLANADAPTSREPARAVELARLATGAVPRSAEYWNTLGVAQFRNNDFPAAVAALNRSVELLGGGDAFDWFFLAMAEQRQGNVDAAERWFEKGAAWVAQQNARTQKRIAPLQNEAAETVGRGTTNPQ